jgi:hypothetical protein
MSAAGRNVGSPDQNDSSGMTAEELGHEIDRQRGELARVKETLSDLQSAVSRLTNVVNGRLAAPPAATTPIVATAIPGQSHGRSSTAVMTYPIGEKCYENRRIHGGCMQELAVPSRSTLLIHKHDRLVNVQPLRA